MGPERLANMRAMLRSGLGRRFVTLTAIAVTGAAVVTVGLGSATGAGASDAHHVVAPPTPPCIPLPPHHHHHHHGHHRGHHFHGRAFVFHHDHHMNFCAPGTTTTTLAPTTTTTVDPPAQPCPGVIINGVCFFSP